MQPGPTDQKGKNGEDYLPHLLPPDWRPTNKVLYGGLSALTTVALIAAAKYFLDIHPDPVVAGAIVSAVYAVIGYAVPNQYRGTLNQLDIAAKLLVDQDSKLSLEAVKQKLQNPMTIARLIASPDGLGDLGRSTQTLK